MKFEVMVKFFNHVAKCETSHSIAHAFRFKAVLSSRKKGSLHLAWYIDDIYLWHHSQRDIKQCLWSGHNPFLRHLRCQRLEGNTGRRWGSHGHWSHRRINSQGWGQRRRRGATLGADPSLLTVSSALANGSSITMSSVQTTSVWTATFSWCSRTSIHSRALHNWLLVSSRHSLRKSRFLLIVGSSFQALLPSMSNDPGS